MHVKSELSISKAWDETKARIAADGRLFVAVALAMIALPTALAQFFVPSTGLTRAPQSLGEILLMLAVWLVGIVGQLALVRLALGRSVSVGEALAHGVRRGPSYVGAMILVIMALMLIAIPFVILLSAMGITIAPGVAPPPAAWLFLVLFIAIILFVAVRMMLTSPVASEEQAGPIAIIKRSWSLTSGNILRLIGFLILFVIGVIIVVGAVSLIANLLVRFVLGPPDPLTAGALIIVLVESIASALATSIFIVMLARIYAQLAGRQQDIASVTVPHSGD